MPPGQADQQTIKSTRAPRTHTKYEVLLKGRRRAVGITEDFERTKSELEGDRSRPIRVVKVGKRCTRESAKAWSHEKHKTIKR